MAARKTIYHRVNGEIEVWAIDAAHALKFTEEWKDRPWTDEEIAEAEGPQGVEGEPSGPVDDNAKATGRKSKTS